MAVGNRGGRPPKNTALHIIDGTFRKDRHAKRSEPKFATKLPTPPAHLDTFAKRRYRQLGGMLLKQGVMTEADMGILAMYAESWSNWIQASTEARRDIARQEAIEAQFDAQIEFGEEDGEIESAIHYIEKRLRKLERRATYNSPAVIRAKEEKLMLDRLGGQLGLSPSMRSKVHVAPPEEKKNPLAEFLHGSSSTG